MNTITNGCCIIDALCGIDTASPQVGQFTDNFNKIKFIIKKNLQGYNILLLTDTDGQVNFITPDDTILIRQTSTNSDETTLLWNIGREITAKSTVVIYQIVAYKGDIANPESTWYSKEGRLTVTESIDSSSASASVIGTYPNLLTRLILNIEKCKEENNTLFNTKVDKSEGKGLSSNDFTDDLKEKLEGVESGAKDNVNPDWNENDESKDSYIKNKPVIGEQICEKDYSVLDSIVEPGMYRIVGRETDYPNPSIEYLFVTKSLSGVFQYYMYNNGHISQRYRDFNSEWSNWEYTSAYAEERYNPESYQAMSGKAVAQALASLADSAPETLDTLKEIADALNNDPDFGASIITELSKKANSSDLSKVANTGKYNDLSGIPDILSYYDPTNQNPVNSQAILSAINSFGIKIKTILSLDELNSLTNYDDCGIYRLKGGIEKNDTLYLVVNYIRPIQYRFGYKIHKREFSTDKTWSSWEEIVVKSYNDLTDKPNLSEVATSGSYEDLSDKPTILSEDDVKNIHANYDYPVLRAESDSDGNKISLTYAKKNDVVTSYNDLTDKPNLSAVATSGSYNDLTNKPITVLNYEPTNEQLAQMGEGIYLARVGDYTFPDCLYFFSAREEWEIYDNVACKHRSWTVNIISHNGVRVERKDNYRFDGREDITIDWREVPLNDNMANKEYVDTAIGDVETSLENIIIKYGLGGDEV